MKKLDLLKIIKEEIDIALSEGTPGNIVLPSGASTSDVSRYTKQGLNVSFKDASGKTATHEVELEEEQLDEMARSLEMGEKATTDIEPRLAKANFKAVVDKILSKVDGKKTMAQIARDLGLIQQKIRPIVSSLVDVGILKEKEVSKEDRPSSPKTTSPKPSTKPSASTPEPSPSPSDMTDDDEEVEAAKAAGSDETAIELGKASTRKDKIIKAYQELQPQVKDKIAKQKEGDKAAAEWLKNTWTPILKAYNKAKEVKL